MALALAPGCGVDRAFSYPRNWLFSKSPDLVISGPLPGFRPRTLLAFRGIDRPHCISGARISRRSWPRLPSLWRLQFRRGRSDDGAADVVCGADGRGYHARLLAESSARRQQILPARSGRCPCPCIWLPAVLWETGLSTLLLIGMVALALRGVDKPTKGHWLAMGAYGGLAMLVNPSLMLAFFAILGWTVHQTRPLWRCGPWVCLLTWLAVFAPWPLRNARVLHAFIPLRSNFGYEIWQGNHPGATSVFDSTTRAAAQQTGVLRLRGHGGSRIHAQQSNLARDLHPGPSGRVHQAQRRASGSLLDGRRVCGELRRGGTTRGHDFAAGPGGTCGTLQTAPRGGGAVSAATAFLSTALLHHARRISFPAGVGSAVDDFERLRGHPGGL